MALVLKDRVKETTTTTGTGTVTLAGASTGYQSFSVVGNANTTYYCIAGQGTAEWEVGIGTYTASGTTLSRDTILASSNSGSVVTFSAGTKDVFVVYPAGKSVNLDASGNATALGTPASCTVTNFTGTASININGTVGATTPSTGAFTTLSASGVATFSAGSAAAPSITTSGDTNTGIFFPAADTIAFTEGGAEAMRIDSSGNVGIGVTPSFWSSVYKVMQLGAGGAVSGRTDNNSVRLYSNFYSNNSGVATYINSDYATAYQQSSGQHTWYTAPSGTAGNAISFTQAMTLDASGNLGVANTSPSSYNSVADNLVIGASGSNGLTIVSGTTGDGSIHFADGTSGADAYRGQIYYNHTGNYMVFGTDGTERARITSSGVFYLGPQATNFSFTNGSAVDLSGSGTGLAGNGTNLTLGVWNGPIVFQAGNSGGALVERARIDSSGNVNIGSSAYTRRLSVKDTTNTVVVIEGSNSGSSNINFADSDSENPGSINYSHATNYMAFQTAGAERARIDASGNVGIGTSSPSSKLEVYDATSAVARVTAGTEIFEIRNTGSEVRLAVVSADPMTFRTSNVEAMRIDSSGNVGIGTSSPSTYGKFAVQTQTSNAPTVAITGSGLNPQLNHYINDSTAVLRNLNQIQFVTGSSDISNYQGYMTFSTMGSAGGTISERMRIDASGNLRVGTTSGNADARTTIAQGSTDSSPCIDYQKGSATTTTAQVYARFFCNGGSTATGSITANGVSAATFTAYSDRRLKENIVDLPSQLNNIMSLRPVEFDYKGYSSGDGHQIGFIAQEVQSVYPDLVAEGDNGMLTLSDMNKNDARLIKAIQELKAIVDAQAARIAALEAQ